MFDFKASLRRSMSIYSRGALLNAFDGHVFNMSPVLPKGASMRILHYPTRTHEGVAVLDTIKSKGRCNAALRAELMRYTGPKRMVIPRLSRYDDY